MKSKKPPWTTKITAPIINEGSEMMKQASDRVMSENGYGKINWSNRIRRA